MIVLKDDADVPMLHPERHLRPGDSAMGAANAYAAYRAAELQTISQRDLIVRLYQGAERFLIQAQAGIHNKQPEMAHVNCQKAKAIFSELLSTLNVENGGEVAGQLKEIYLFLIVKTVEANLRKDAELIARLLPIVATLREAWQQVPDDQAQITSIPVGSQGQVLSLKT
jgi:flagellar secretion chaperone FliS